MDLIRVGPLPDDPLRAAAAFYAAVMPRIAPNGPAPLALVFDPADRTHRAWRLAAVQGLARQLAPIRVNAISGSDELAVLAAATYLRQAPGVTGQYLPLAPDHAAV